MQKNNTAEQRKLGQGQLVLWCFVAFLLTSVVSLIAASIKGGFPFGDRSIYFNDLFSDYSVFLTELWRKIHTGGSLFFSWKTGLGGSFWGNYLYYLSSPFNLFVLLVKENQIDEAITVLVYLRQALSSVFMCLFLCRRRKGKPSWAGALCGFLYSTCGWYCSYYFVAMWLDFFMLMPLLLLGIERIIDRGAPLLYFGVFTIMLFSNFFYPILLLFLQCCIGFIISSVITRWGISGKVNAEREFHSLKLVFFCGDDICHLLNYVCVMSFGFPYSAVVSDVP